MKTTTSMLACLFFTLVAGCEIAGITDSAVVSMPESAGVSKNTPVNVLILDAVLLEPGNAFNSLVVVDGRAEYTLRVVQMDPVPPNPQVAAVLELDLRASLTPLGSGSGWEVTGSSVDWIPLSDGHEASLTKRYHVKGRSRKTYLNVAFRIMETEIQVDHLWLELAPRPEVGNSN